MAIDAANRKNAADVDRETPGTYRLILSAKPFARVVKYETIPAAMNGGVEVEKYSTRFGADFEKHTDKNGIVTWWRLLKVSSTLPQGDST